MWYHRADANSYLLLLGFDLFLRERSLVAALRTFPGPVIGMGFSNPSLLKRNRFIDYVLDGSPLNAEGVLAAVAEFERQSGLKPSAVVPLLDLTLNSGYVVAEQYGLPYLSDECIENSRNKSKMKGAFRRHGLPTPDHATFSDFEELQAKVKEIGFPCVIKPSELGGSLGVVRVDGPDDLRKAFESCLHVLDGHADQLFVERNRFQVESFVPARHEVSVEVLNYGSERIVLAVTDKYLSPPPFFAEIGHVVPSVYSGNARLRELAKASCEALGIDRGVAHVEIRITDEEEMFLIEVGARPAGDAILDQVERAYGISPYEYHVRSYLNQIDSLPDLPAPKGTSAIAFLKAREGKIVDILTPEKLPENVVSLYVTAAVGDISKSCKDYEGREGAVEFYWNHVHEGSPLQEHLEIANRLSDEIFIVEQ